MSETTFTIEGTTLIIERILKAPKETIWEAWANPELFAIWWGPRGWITTVAEHDFINGGSLRYGMKCEDKAQIEWYGQESWGKMVFENVHPHDSFSYIDYFTDDKGNITEGMPSVKTINTLEQVSEGTRFVSRGIYDSPEDLKTVMDMGMEEGVRQTWDRLEELLSKQA
jgi:uncharacterized protein YndB with AHSA1/START domain